MTITNLDITEMVSNPTNPHVVSNDGVKILGAAIAGVLTHDMASDADYTLATTGTVPYEWQNGTIEITDTGVVLTTTRNIICPTNKKVYIFYNNTAQSLVLKTSAGTGITVATTKTAILRCDGTNVVRLTADI